MPTILCCICGEIATCLVRKDYDVKKGGMSMCDACRPSRGVWVLLYDAPGVEKVSGSVVNRGRVKGHGDRVHKSPRGRAKGQRTLV